MCKSAIKVFFIHVLTVVVVIVFAFLAFLVWQIVPAFSRRGKREKKKND